MSPREIRELRIPFALYAKLTSKGIEVEEVREAVANAPNVRRGPRNLNPDQEGNCYFIMGRTHAGRSLKVLVRLFADGGAMVITAWDPHAQ